MESKKESSPTYTAEFRERGVRLYRDHRSDYTSDTAAYRADASKLGCSHDTLRAWCLQAARDTGKRSGLTTDERVHLKELERENRELRTANEILKKASAYFAQAELDRPFRKLSPSSKSIARSSGSSRSAVFCRSPRQPSIAMPPSLGMPSLPRIASGRVLWTSK